MIEEKKLFFPLFYNALELTGSLSDAEFGHLIRELLRSDGTKAYSPNLETKLMLAYCFMLDNAIRIFNSCGKPKYYIKRKKDSTREYNFDAEEAFAMALARATVWDKGEKSEEAKPPRS